MLDCWRLAGASAPLNFAFMFEGEEENGSLGFQESVAANLDWFADASLVIISNTVWVGENRPCLTYGMRGMVTASLVVSTDVWMLLLPCHVWACKVYSASEQPACPCSLGAIVLFLLDVQASHRCRTAQLVHCDGNVDQPHQPSLHCWVVCRCGVHSGTCTAATWRSDSQHSRTLCLAL